MYHKWLLSLEARSERKFILDANDLGHLFFSQSGLLQPRLFQLIQERGQARLLIFHLAEGLEPSRPLPHPLVKPPHALQQPGRLGVILTPPGPDERVNFLFIKPDGLARVRRFSGPWRRSS